MLINIELIATLKIAISVELQGSLKMETEQKPEIHGHLKILGKDLAFLQKRIFIAELQKP